MNELTIFEHNGQLVTDSREIAEMVDKRHDHLLRDIDGYVQILQNPTLGNGLELVISDFFVKSEYQAEDGGRKYPCYLITRKGCDMVANKMTGAKGVLFTAVYVTKFEEMEKAIKSFQIPQTLPEALRAYADEVEKRQLAEAQVAVMAPKAEFFDAVADSKDAIDIGSAAKVLNMGIGRNRLFEFLRDKQVLMNNNQPYQSYVDRGYFRTIEQKYSKPDGSTQISIKTLVYQKGLDYIRRLLNTA